MVLATDSVPIDRLSKACEFITATLCHEHEKKRAREERVSSSESSVVEQTTSTAESTVEVSPSTTGSVAVKSMSATESFDVEDTSEDLEEAQLESSDTSSQPTPSSESEGAPSTNSSSGKPVAKLAKRELSATDLLGGPGFTTTQMSLGNETRTPSPNVQGRPGHAKAEPVKKKPPPLPIDDLPPHADVEHREAKRKRKPVERAKSAPARDVRHQLEDHEEQINQNDPCIQKKIRKARTVEPVAAHPPQPEKEKMKNEKNQKEKSQKEKNPKRKKPKRKKPRRKKPKRKNPKRKKPKRKNDNRSYQRQCTKFRKLFQRAEAHKVFPRWRSKKEEMRTQQSRRTFSTAGDTSRLPHKPRHHQQEGAG